MDKDFENWFPLKAKIDAKQKRPIFMSAKFGGAILGLILAMNKMEKEKPLQDQL